MRLCRNCANNSRLRLEEGKPRVLKQYRGNGGNGVWKVEQHPSDPALVRVRHALRGSVEQDIPLDAFLTQCEAYFTGSGRLIDQAYQERLAGRHGALLSRRETK